jgi:hypothetical protein
LGKGDVFISLFPIHNSPFSKQVQFLFELGDGFLAEAAIGARAADFRLHIAVLDGGLVLENLQAQVQFSALDAKPLGVVIALAQQRDVLVELALSFQLRGGIALARARLLQGEGQAGGQAQGQLIGKLGAGHGFAEWCGGRRLAQFGGVRAEAADGFQRFLLLLPIAVSAELPIGQIVLVDRLVVKFSRHEGYHFGQGVEPFGDLFAFCAVFEAVVDLLANGLRQPRDFTSSRHKKDYF